MPIRVILFLLSLFHFFVFHFLPLPFVLLFIISKRAETKDGLLVEGVVGIWGGVVGIGSLGHVLNGPVHLSPGAVINPRGTLGCVSLDGTFFFLGFGLFGGVFWKDGFGFFLEILRGAGHKLRMKYST